MIYKVLLTVIKSKDYKRKKIIQDNTWKYVLSRVAVIFTDFGFNQSYWLWNRNSFSIGMHVERKRKFTKTSNFQRASKLYGADQIGAMETIPGKGARQRWHEYANLNKGSTKSKKNLQSHRKIHFLNKSFIKCKRSRVYWQRDWLKDLN